MSGAPRSQFESRVVSNTSLCREHFRLTLKLDGFPATEPGQFVQISCRPMNGVDEDSDRDFDWTPGIAPMVSGAELCRPLAMLRRPFSLAGRRDDGERVEIDIIHRIVGVGTGSARTAEPLSSKVAASAANDP